MLSVKPLTATQEQRDKIIQKACEEIDRAVSARSEMEKQWTQAVKQFNGRMERENAPPPMANMDIGLTREYSQQSAASLLNPFLQQPTYFITIPREPQFEDVSREVNEVLDYICDKADIQTICEQWVKASHIFHYSFVKVPWIVKKRTIREWVWEERQVTDPTTGEPVFDMMPGADGMPVMVPAMEKVRVEKDVEVEDEVGAIPEVVPSEDTIFPTDAKDVETARWFDHRFYLSRPELRKRIKAQEYEGNTENIRVEEVKKAEFAVEEKKLLGMDISGQKLAEHHEVYTTLGEIRDWLEDEEFEPDYDADCEIIITIDKTNRQWRRGIHNFFHAHPRPFVGWCYEGRKDGIAGISLCYILKPHHTAYSAMVCQELDAQSAANENIVFGRMGSDVGKAFKNNRLRGGFYEINGMPSEDIAQFSVSQPRTTSSALRAEIQSHAERLSNKNPFSFGQVTTSHISATGQMAQQNEAAQPLYSVLESFRLALSKVAYMMLARYKQFYPDGMPFFLRTEGEDGVELEPGMIHWPSGAIETSVYVETKVSSSTMNKEIRRQEKLAMVDKIPQVYMTLSQMVGQAMTPSPMSPVMAKLAQAYQLVVDDWLTEFEVNNKNVINPDLSQEVQIGQQFQQLLGQIQSLSQKNAQLEQQLGGLVAAIQGVPPPGPGGPGAPPPQPGPPGAPPPPSGPAGPVPNGPPPVGIG